MPPQAGCEALRAHHPRRFPTPRYATVRRRRTVKPPDSLRSPAWSRRRAHSWQAPSSCGLAVANQRVEVEFDVAGVLHDFLKALWECSTGMGEQSSWNFRGGEIDDNEYRKLEALGAIRKQNRIFLGMPSS